MSEPVRCAWVLDNPISRCYHDDEWGRITHDERYLFEMLMLEGAEAGLSWHQILSRRDAYRLAFHDFVPERVVRMHKNEITDILNRGEIIRHRAKADAVVHNAHAFLAVQESFAGFYNYLWSFTNGTQVQNCWENHCEIPVKTPLSIQMSKDMKKRGFLYVGPVICYAYLQAVGVVNDHTVDCFQWGACNARVV